MSDYGKSEALTHDNFFSKLSEFVDAKDTPATPGKPKDSDALLTFISGKQLMTTVYPEQRWLVESFIPDTGMVCLSGMPSSYKSWFGFYIALCVLRGQPILERFTTQKGAVLFIDKENIEPQIQDRMKMLGAGEEMGECYFTQGNFTTENLSSLATVVEFIKSHNIKLVIIDSLIRIHSRDENVAVEMNKVFERLAEFQNAGAAVLYLHHLRKATYQSADPMERLRGSVDISARLDSLIAVESKDTFVTVTHGKSRYVEAVPKFIMQFSVNKKNEANFFYHKEVEEGQAMLVAVEDSILGLLREGTTTRKFLIDTLIDRHSQRAIEEALSALYASGQIIKWKESGKGNNTLYGINKVRTFLDEDSGKLN